MSAPRNGLPMSGRVERERISDMVSKETRLTKLGVILALAVLISVGGSLVALVLAGLWRLIYTIVSGG
jgi:hypothetical protein